MLKINKASSVPYTECSQFKYDWMRTESNQHWWSLNVNLENIILKQVPNETLSMKVFFDRIKPKHYCEESDGSTYEVSITLTFQNNLHEFSQYYVYELLCEISRGDQRQPERLFSMIETRESSLISVKICITYPTILNPQNMNFHVRRHNLDFCKREMESCTNLKLLCENVPTDVTIIVGDKNIPAHRFILSHKSETFKAMFANEMMETKKGIVKIENFDPNVIRGMINFIYTGEVEDIEGIRYHLYRAAHQYQLHDLCLLCIEYILFNSNYENLADTLELAALYEIKELKKRAWTFFKNHTEEVSKEQNFHDYLCRTIKLENVVDTLLVAKKYNIDKVYGKALDFIGKNFCKMKDNEDFSKLFESNPCLMREIFHFYCASHA